MAEGFLNVPPRELGFDHIANLGCPGLAIPAKRSPTMADEVPRFRGDPILPLPNFGFGFEAR